MIESIILNDVGKKMPIYIGCIDKKILPCDHKMTIYKAGSMPSPVFIRGEGGSYKLKLLMEITSSYSDELRNYVFMWSHYYNIIYEFRNDSKKYNCILKSATPTFLCATKAFLELEYDCEIYDKSMTNINVTAVNQNKIITGARPTRLNFILESGGDLTNFPISFTVGGKNYRYVFKTVAKYSRTTINGIDGIADLAKINMTDFAEGVGDLTVTEFGTLPPMSSFRIEYYARW